MYNNNYRTFGINHKDNENKHVNFSSGSVKSFIYGGIDGLFTSFCLLMSTTGAKINYTIFLVLNLSNILGGAISMGCGDFLSSYSELELVQKEYSREKREMEMYPKEELNEMVEIYINRYNIPKETAKYILSSMFSYSNLFLDHMFNLELGLIAPKSNDFNEIIQESIITFFSFIIFGSIPLLSLLITSSLNISIGISFFSTFTLGYFKGYIIKENKLLAGIKLLLVATICGSLSYYIAQLSQYLFLTN